MKRLILLVAAALGVVAGGPFAACKLVAEDFARPPAGDLPAVLPTVSLDLSGDPAVSMTVAPGQPAPVPSQAALPTVQPFGLTPGHGALHPAASARPLGPDAIVVHARFAQRWAEGTTTVRLLRGPVTIQQQGRLWEAREVVCWETTSPSQSRLTCYLDGESTARTESMLSAEGVTSSGRDRLVTLISSEPPHWRGIVDDVEGDASSEPVVVRASQRRALTDISQPIQQTQFQTSVPNTPMIGQNDYLPVAPDDTFGRPLLVPPALDTPLVPPALTPGRLMPGQLFPGSFADRVTITPRNFEVPFHVESRPVPGTVPQEQIITVTRGVNVVIERPLEGDLIDLTADSAVIWTDAQLGEQGSLNFDLGPQTPFQVYLAGNIVLRQGKTVARAREAYFDRREGRGLLVDAEVRTFVPTLRGDLRVRAESVRFNVLTDQIESVGGSDIELFANNAWVTASRFGKPTYRLQAGTLALQQRPIGQQVNPMTGRTTTVNEPWLVTTNNQFLLGELPIAASPYLASPAQDFSVPIKRATVSSDSVFGTQLLTRWDVGDLFGLSLPPDTSWTFDVDYLSERGPRVGSDWGYDFGHDLGGLRARSYGTGLASFVYDDGNDVLGLGRRNLIPDQKARGALIGRHRTVLPYGTTLTGELGVVSDFNFLEQYEEFRWDSDKDAETLLELRQQFDNLSWSVLGRPQTNDFYNQTEWLPRADVTLLGQPLARVEALNTSLNWSQHSMVGYGQIEPSTGPVNPGQPFTPLPWLADVDGSVVMTRHELTLPFNVGAVKVVPYALGELAHWGESLDGTELSRAYGSAGVRGSLLFTKVMPYVRSDIWGLNGLAHKMVFDFDYSISESTADLDELAIYNEFDDNAQERFRQRFVGLTFGGVLPPTADPRGYALRTGAGRSVTAPFHELVDDQHVLRLGWRHRLQTRTGPPQNRRLRDWMTLDLEASFFPGAEAFDAEDNFGEDLGLLTARYAWNVGDRTTILADALYDLFTGGQETWSVGVLSQRPGRGSLYLGYRQLSLSDLDSQILSFNYSYVMSEKWASMYGFAYDIGEGRGQGHSLSVVRVGKDFVTRVGFDYDESKDNFGVSFLIEPFIGRRDATDIDSLIRRRTPRLR